MKKIFLTILLSMFLISTNLYADFSSVTTANLRVTIKTSECANLVNEVFTNIGMKSLGNIHLSGTLLKGKDESGNFVQMHCLMLTKEDYNRKGVSYMYIIVNARNKKIQKSISRKSTNELRKIIKERYGAVMGSIGPS